MPMKFVSDEGSHRCMLQRCSASGNKLQLQITLQIKIREGRREGGWASKREVHRRTEESSGVVTLLFARLAASDEPRG